MSGKPFFSIVIPTYNRADKLQFALYCLKRQTFRDYEIIVSDNWSTDKTHNVVRRFGDKRIRYVRNPAPTVYAYNLQNAIDHASGKYIFFHSDDDVMPDPDALEKIHAKILEVNPGFVRVNYCCISPGKDRLFFFSPDQAGGGDFVLTRRSVPDRIMAFIEHSEQFFITGLVLCNAFPRSVRIINSDHAPWIRLLIHGTRTRGGLFIVEPFIAATWSTGNLDRRKNADGGHPVYSLHDGRLESEYYFEAVRPLLADAQYRGYLRRLLTVMYIRIFPAIKILVGNRGLLALAGRLRKIDRTLGKSVVYWAMLGISLVIPAGLLWYIKNAFRSAFMAGRTLPQSGRMMANFREVEETFMASRYISSGPYTKFFSQ